MRRRPVAADVRRRTQPLVAADVRRRMLAVFLAIFLPPCLILAAEQPLALWYPRPADKWVEAVPVGNGRLGGMIFGGITNEHLQFNENTLWTGQPHEYHHDGAAKFLPSLRRLLLEGKQAEAEELALKEFMSVPLRQKAYQPFGDVWLSFLDHTNTTEYRRQLDLESAVARVEYLANGVQYPARTVRQPSGSGHRLAPYGRPARPTQFFGETDHG